MTPERPNVAGDRCGAHASGDRSIVEQRLTRSAR